MFSFYPSHYVIWVCLFLGLDEILCPAYPTLSLLRFSLYPFSCLLSHSVSVSASPLELQVGSNVMLQCEVEGLSPGSEVQLMRPDGRPHTGSKKGELNVNYTDEGTWECTFSYGTEKYSEKLDVKIKGMTLASTQDLAYAFYQYRSYPCGLPENQDMLCLFFFAFQSPLQKHLYHP